MEVDRFRTKSPAVDWRSLLSRWPLKSVTPTFLVYVSAIEARKRQLQFLSVFSEISREDPDAVLLFVGDGVQRSELESRIHELGLQGRAICVGYQENVEDWISIARVCLLTSLREGLARVLVQYALMQRPIIATDIPGCRTIVNPGMNGFLVPTDHLEQMRGPILSLLRDPGLAERMGRANDAVDLTPWSAATMTSRTDTVYNTALANR
jgi:glycosyltransferase involved in cell wall biosynthesis